MQTLKGRGRDQGGTQSPMKQPAPLSQQCSSLISTGEEARKAPTNLSPGNRTSQDTVTNTALPAPRGTGGLETTQCSGATLHWKSL